MARDRNDDGEVEARRILDRVGRESESGGRDVVERAARRVRDHVSASDVDNDDWAEYWGTRIGRLLGPVFVVALILWLLLFLVRGG